MVLARSYQGHSLNQQLAVGEALRPQEIMELEQADRRAAAAMENLTSPSIVVPARSSPD